MEVHINSIMDTIKSEAILKAQETAGDIKSSAEHEARKIIEKAKAEAYKIVDDAKKESAAIALSQEAALKQSARDLILNLKSSVESLFSTIVKQQVGSELKGEFLKSVIVRSVEALVKGEKDVSILLSKEDLKSLDDGFKKKLADTITSGVELKGSPSVDGGFRVSAKNGALFYDFSSEEIAKMLTAYLNPKISSLISQ